MKSHKRCHAVAVGRKTVTRHTNYFGTLHLERSIVCHMQSYNKIL